MCVLETALFLESHTAENLSLELEDVLFRWGVSRKNASALVTDNVSSMLAACKLIGVPSFPCFTHSLQLIINSSSCGPL